jgi:hypothetical protein
MKFSNIKIKWKRLKALYIPAQGNGSAPLTNRALRNVNTRKHTP